jgi:dTDP-4-amino-4,6-dideoxygalactose transaminase
MDGLSIPFTGIKRQYNNLRTEILDVTDEVLRSGRLMNGNNTIEFETWLAKKNHSKYAVTCHSGTQALEIIASYYSMIIRRSPTVLLPALTYPATINAFVRNGWEATIIDTDKYGIMDYNKIANDFDYDAVVLVGLYGADVSGHLSQKTKGIIIEDAAQHWLAHDATRFGNAAAISFDPMKNLPNYGNGGAVVTDDIDLVDFARMWRDNGKPTHQASGTNSRMSEIDCAQMLVKAKYINQWQARRLEIASYWISRFKNTNIRSLIDASNFPHHSFHKFVIDTNNRDILQRNLQLCNIETKIHYKEALHEMPAYIDSPSPDMLSCSVALSRRVLSLPFYPELTDLEVEYVIDSVIAHAS